MNKKHTIKTLTKRISRPKAEGFKTVSARIVRADPARDNGEFLLKAKFVKPVTAERLAELIEADQNDLLIDAVMDEVDVCDNATADAAERLVTGIGRPKDDAWPWEWGFHDYTYDEEKSALCVESIWSFNANY